MPIKNFLKSQIPKQNLTFAIIYSILYNGNQCQLSSEQHSLKLPSFVFNRREKLIQVWNNLGVGK